MDSPHKGPVTWNTDVWYPEQAIEQTVKIPVIWEEMTLMWIKFHQTTHISGPAQDCGKPIANTLELPVLYYAIDTCSSFEYLF